MERSMEASLEMQARNNELSAEGRDRAMRHAQETQHHAEAVQKLLRNLGSDISTIKTGLGTMTQLAKGVASAFARDERIKDLLDSYAMEHFEIASYTALAAAAERAGMPEVVQVCNRIIPDEHRMAQAIIQSLPEQVTMYLFETETAKR
jgi:ferritin-like metal-binding protein YciE